MTDTHHSIVIDRHEKLGAGAWATGFSKANALVDAGAARTRLHLLANIYGIDNDAAGNITAFDPAAIGASYDLPWANAADFVNGVKASLEANRTLIGEQDV